MNKINFTPKFELILISVLTFFSFVLWDSFLIYPIKMLSVMIHETFHAFTTLLTGGKISSINIDLNLGGKIETEFGSSILISLSGYFGSLFVGLLFFKLSQNEKLFRFFIYSLSIMILIVLANSNPNADYIFISLLIISFLIFIAVFINNNYFQFLIRFLGLVSMIYVLIDLKNDLLNDFYVSDAKILSDIINVNSFLITLVWIFVTSALIFVTVKNFYFRND
ncbi:MAG: M50 family metallopeptidase [Stygiobacter sp.]